MLFFWCLRLLPFERNDLCRERSWISIAGVRSWLSGKRGRTSARPAEASQPEALGQQALTLPLPLPLTLPLPLPLPLPLELLCSV